MKFYIYWSLHDHSGLRDFETAADLHSWVRIQDRDMIIRAFHGMEFSV